MDHREEIQQFADNNIRVEIDEDNKSKDPIIVTFHCSGGSKANRSMTSFTPAKFLEI